MKIGILGDTHIPGAAPALPAQLITSLEGVDLILHTGDILGLDVLETLSRIAPVQAVWGNMDPAETRSRIPERTTLEVEGFRIGLTHGSGSPSGIVERVKREFSGIDCLVFGHTHSPLNKMNAGVLFLNPGSPTDHRFATVNTFAILNVDEELSAEIIELPR